LQLVFHFNLLPAVEDVLANMVLFSENELIPKQWDGKLLCILIHLGPESFPWQNYAALDHWIRLSHQPSTLFQLVFRLE
jgi:hypothetical protein